MEKSGAAKRKKLEPEEEETESMPTSTNKFRLLQKGLLLELRN